MTQLAHGWRGWWWLGINWRMIETIFTAMQVRAGLLYYSVVIEMHVSL